MACADETLIDYYGQGDALYAIVMRGRDITGVKLSADGLEDQVRAFREAIVGRRPQALEMGKALYGRLIAPVAGDVRSVTYET